MMLNLNSNITTYSPDPLTTLMDLAAEPFFEAIDDKTNKTPASEAAITLFTFSMVCRDLKMKVDHCWGTFIKYAGTTRLLITPFSESFSTDKPKSSRKFIAKQLPILKKWKDLSLEKWLNVDPIILQHSCLSSMRQYVSNNNLGPELLIANAIKYQNSTYLSQVNLNTFKTVEKKLLKHLIPSAECICSIVSSEHWIAICSCMFNEMDISLFDIETGKCISTISRIDKICQLQSEKDFLYVLCKEYSGKSKMLRYDIKKNDSIVTPWLYTFEKLDIANKTVEIFYIFDNDILFVSACENKQYQITATKKDLCFLDKPTQFVKADPQLNFPLIRYGNNTLFTLSPFADPLSKSPSVCLQQLQINDSKIEKNNLHTFQINISDVRDFCVLFDKIFILTQKNLELSILCYDLKDGTCLKNFSQTIIPTCVADLKPKLEIISGKGIQLLYTKYEDKRKNAMKEFYFNK